MSHTASPPLTLASETPARRSCHKDKSDRVRPVPIFFFFFPKELIVGMITSLLPFFFFFFSRIGAHLLERRRDFAGAA